MEQRGEDFPLIFIQDLVVLRDDANSQFEALPADASDGDGGGAPRNVALPTAGLGDDVARTDFAQHCNIGTVQHVAWDSDDELARCVFFMVNGEINEECFFVLSSILIDFFR